MKLISTTTAHKKMMRSFKAATLLLRVPVCVCVCVRVPVCVCLCVCVQEKHEIKKKTAQIRTEAV